MTTKLLMAISALSTELTILMHEQPELEQRLLKHQTAIRQALIEILTDGTDND